MTDSGAPAGARALAEAEEHAKGATDYHAGRIRQVFDKGSQKSPRWTVTDAHQVQRLLRLVDAWEREWDDHYDCAGRFEAALFDVEVQADVALANGVKNGATKWRDGLALVRALSQSATQPATAPKPSPQDRVPQDSEPGSADA